jgi:F0F1-type ATP synthase membrane subunit c/vacuolar-type H+-ATPase subunit K
VRLSGWVMFGAGVVVGVAALAVGIAEYVRSELSAITVEGDG